jgi:hypothetical protein
MKNLVKLSFMAICIAALSTSCTHKTDEHSQAAADSAAAAHMTDSTAAANSATSMDSTHAASADSVHTEAPAEKK